MIGGIDRTGGGESSPRPHNQEVADMLRFLSVLLIGLIGCATATQGGFADRTNNPDAVLGKTWQWEETVTPVEKVTVSDPNRYSIRFLKDRRLQAQFDCNRGGGAYEISAGRLSFGPMMATRMACPEDSLDWRFMQDLHQVVSFFVENDRLYLGLSADGGTMRFRPVP
jgi:heat shock protein HslJ